MPTRRPEAFASRAQSRQSRPPAPAENGVSATGGATPPYVGTAPATLDLATDDSSEAPTQNATPALAKTSTDIDAPGGYAIEFSLELQNIASGETCSLESPYSALTCELDGFNHSHGQKQ